MIVSDYSVTRDTRPRAFPIGSGLSVVGAAMMAAGAWGPWIGGHFFGGTQGIQLGGDGWLVVTAAALALLPLVLPLPPSSIKGVWVIGCALGSAYVCWSHFAQAGVDGLDVDWGLQLASVGTGALGLSGVRLLLPHG